MIYENAVRVLFINVSTGKVRVENRKDLLDYLGGVGIATKLLEENMRPELDPLDEEQPVIFAIGAISNIFPVLTKTVAMFRSPLTGELGESYAGGRLALTMLHAGYDAIVITGKARKPTYISISSNNVQLKDARALWGLSSDDVGRFIREKEAGGGKRSIVRIGPAGENGVTYASACVDTYRHFGRLGLGAVLGSKNLKAVSITGDRSMPIKNFKDYFKVYQDIYKKVTDTEIMAKYHDAGTPINVEPLNAAGGLPTKNLKQGVFEYGENISGETFAKKNLVRKMACTGCPVGCIHIGQFRREFDKGHEYEAISVGYDYELIFALGSFIGVKTSEEILELIERVEALGMDAMSAGVVLGWATEAYMKKLVTEEQTLTPIAFGDTAGYIKVLNNIAEKKNEFYEALGKGVVYASSIYGGEEFAMNMGKNEMAGYHTGYGSVVGATVGARHSHLCNGGYSIDQSMKEFNKEDLVDKLYKEEKERCMLNSLTICLFARKVYDRPTILSALHSVGYDYTDEDLTKIGERILASKQRIKKAFGFNLADVKLPKRFFSTPSMTGTIDENITYELISMYNKKIEELLQKEI